MNILKALFSGNSNAITVEDAQARINNGSNPIFVLDVRQSNEYKSGHIAGAKLIPLNELGSRMQELPKDKDILCVCRSGSRSSAATRQLTNAGFTAINMRGGMMAWERANYPTKRGK